VPVRPVPAPEKDVPETVPAATKELPLNAIQAVPLKTPADPDVAPPNQYEF
jgi:hypothetical protein